uniref:Uncharacterized protein n=1 Tax=Arundo donax TaxID=35708 RepID=A0A0A8YAW9_ARUDO
MMFQSWSEIFPQALRRPFVSLL